MPEEHKKSFMLYFDNYKCIAALSAEQRGELLLQLFRYALAETIRRDTEKWKAKQRRYQAAAARRQENSPSPPPVGGGKTRGMPRSDPNDVSWMKKYLEQREKE